MNNLERRVFLFSLAGYFSYCEVVDGTNEMVSHGWRDAESHESLYVLTCSTHLLLL